jgi:ParB/RepB/Spo0J family partition protein
MKINESKFRDLKEIDEHTYFGWLKVSELKLSPNNIRPEISKQESKEIEVTLLPSIQVLGMQQLPVCTPEGEVFIGGRRSESYRLKGEKWIPILIKDLDEAEQIKSSLAENKARKDVEPLDEAKQFRKLKKTKNLSSHQIAKETGYPVTIVEDRLRILEVFEQDAQSLGSFKGTKGLTKEQEKKTITYEKANILSRDYVPKKTRDKLVKKIKDEGLSHEELQRELGKGKVVQTIIEEEEKPEIKAQLEQEYGGDKSFEVEPETVLEKQRELKGLAPSLTKIELSSEDFETDAEKIDVQIHPKVMQRIVKYFLDKKGRYVGCEVVVKGEVAKSEKD